MSQFKTEQFVNIPNKGFFVINDEPHQKINDSTAFNIHLCEVVEVEPNNTFFLLENLALAEFCLVPID